MVFVMTSIPSAGTRVLDTMAADPPYDPYDSLARAGDDRGRRGRTGPGTPLSEGAVPGFRFGVRVQGERESASNAETMQVRAIDHALGLLCTARRQAGQGRVAETLLLAEAATCIYRRLAWADPETYLPDLARALTNVGTLRSYRNWESAVAPAQEATRIYRHLTRARVGAVPDVAGSLSSLLAFLWETAAVSSSQIPNPKSAGRA
jgi:hypothetical protein